MATGCSLELVCQDDVIPYQRCVGHESAMMKQNCALSFRDTGMYTPEEGQQNLEECGFGNALMIPSMQLTEAHAA